MIQSWQACMPVCKKDSKQGRSTFPLLHIHVETFQYLSKHDASMGYFPDCWCPSGLFQESHPKKIKLYKFYQI